MKRIMILAILVAASGCPPLDPVGVDIKGTGISPPTNKVGIYAQTEHPDPNNDYEELTSDSVGFGDQLTELHGKTIKQSWSGKVIKISDGDTITVISGNDQFKVRLDSIDTPERKQPFGTKAKDALAAMVHEKTVTIHETGKDRYGRTLGFVAIGYLDICAEMVRQGYAWEYTQYSKSETLGALQQEARNAGRGLWDGKGPDDQVPPWEWRRR